MPSRNLHQQKSGHWASRLAIKDRDGRSQSAIVFSQGRSPAGGWFSVHVAARRRPSGALQPAGTIEKKPWSNAQGLMQKKH